MSRIACSSTSVPDSLLTSIDMVLARLLPLVTAALVGAVLRTVLAVVLLVRVDDTADQLVPDDILGRQPGEVDVLEALQDLLHLPQTGLGAVRQVYLGDITRDDDLRGESEPREERLHLLGAGVLRLVQDDEGVVERPSAHVRQRRDLDG